jgi:hypothetical protein
MHSVSLRLVSRDNQLTLRGIDASEDLDRGCRPGGTHAPVDGTDATTLAGSLDPGQPRIAGFAVMSALGSLAPSPGVLIAGRALQGVFSALVVPTSLALILPEFPPGSTRPRRLLPPPSRARSRLFNRPSWSR